MFNHVDDPVLYLSHLSVVISTRHWLLSGTPLAVSQERLGALKMMRRLRRISVVNESSLGQSGWL